MLDTKLDGQFKLVTDKGTLDAIGLHPDGPARRFKFQDQMLDPLLHDRVIQA